MTKPLLPQHSRYDFVPLTEVLLGKHSHLGNVASCDVADRRPQLRYAFARKPIEDTVPFPPRPRQSGLRKQAQMMRRCRDALPHLRGDLFYRPFALCQHIHDLRAPSVPERGRHRRKRIEKGTLRRAIAHKIKLVFE